MRIAVFGATGFIGSQLKPFLENNGHEVLSLSRDGSLEGVDVVINLAGENIFGRWSEAKKEKIRNSRLDFTRYLTETITQLKNPPKLYVGASAIGYYGNRGLEVLTESSPAGNDFLAEVCEDLEGIVKKLPIRNVMLRLGVVMGARGALAKLKKPFGLGLGAILGDGCQVFSWIDIEDVCRAILFIITEEDITGPVNLVAPNAVTNRELTSLVSHALHKPVFFRIPEFALRGILGEAASIYLNSALVYPEKLLNRGFVFNYPKMAQSLQKNLKLIPKDKRITMKTINTIVLILLIAGAINWGLIGFFNINFVKAIFSAGLGRIIYCIIGIAGLWGFLFFKKVICDCPQCSFFKKK